jgi:hypothetical protein
VFSSIEYLDRLAHPTPDTAAIMRDGFLNTSRTICRRIAPRGSVRGAVVVTAAVEEPSPETALAAVVRQYPVSHAVAHTEVWVSAGAPHGGVSAEQAIRGGEDQMISGCVTVELLREGDALLVAADIRRALPRAEVGVYRLLCSLGKEDLQCESC